MKFFSEEQVNKGRQPELDWLKAACILMMIMLHVYDDCAAEPGGRIRTSRRSSKAYCRISGPLRELRNSLTISRCSV